ncbi:MAG: lytic murein transglycosylase B [Gallionella sp.]|jgi:membrane-bound lytic murein transglycosylase B
MKLFLRCVFLVAGSLLAFPVCAATLPGIPEFIDEMVVKHQFNRDELTVLFERANHRPQIIEAISRPAMAKPWLEYRASFVNPQRVKLGLIFWDKYRTELLRAEKKYGVPQEIIVALIGVETVYGQSMGSFRTLDALTTLAFDYPRRSAFFRDELENYLLLAREQQLDLLEVRGSYAGALGIPQFMPSSYHKYAVDFNGNHKTDLLNEAADAIGSVGNYMNGYGWDNGGPIAVRAEVADGCCAGIAGTPRSPTEWAYVGVTSGVKNVPADPARLLNFTVTEGREYWLVFNNFDVITRYNNSNFYAMSVFQLSEALKAAHQANTVICPSNGSRRDVARRAITRKHMKHTKNTKKLKPAHHVKHRH